MNDTELDEMLDQWDAPAIRASLRESIRAGFTAARKPQENRGAWARWLAALVPGTRKRLFAGAVVGAVVCLLVVTQAAPQALRLGSPGFRIPYVVEYDFVRYANDGSPSTESHITAFKSGGDVIPLSITNSNSPFLNLVQVAMYSSRRILLEVAPSLIIPQESSESIARNRAYVSSGCVAGETVIGHETVVGHATTVVQTSSPGGRTTRWLAPGLGCFALKHLNEEQRPDGTFRVVLRQQALKVTVNP